MIYRVISNLKLPEQLKPVVWLMKQHLHSHFAQLLLGLISLNSVSALVYSINTGLSKNLLNVLAEPA